MKTHISKCDVRKPKYRKKITYSVHKVSEEPWCKEDSQYYWAGETWGGYDWQWMMSRHIKDRENEAN